MITLTRCQARDLRAVLRRRALGIAHRGELPPLLFVAEPGVGLRVRFHHPPLALDCLLPGDPRREGPVALPLEALAELEGRDDTPVTLEAAGPGRTLARWRERGTDRSREFATTSPAARPPFPETLDRLEACPATLLDALAEAAATTDEESTRYALGCILLRGGPRGEVVATDGRQLLIQGGFPLPWEGDALVRRTPPCLVALPRDRPILVGRSAGHVVLRAGSWTAWLEIRADARYPRVEGIVPDAGGPATRLHLDLADARALADTLGDLPGGDAPHAPATLDLNGRIAVRALAGGSSPPAELVLARSHYSGPPIRLATDRRLLARAARLGFRELEARAADAPVVCRDGRRVYLWQPLGPDAAIGPDPDATAAHPDVTHHPEPPTEARPAMRVPIPESRPPGEPGAAHAEAAGLAALIAEAEALHEALADARARAGRLAVALRRHRKRERLVAATLASLRQLRLPADVAG